jgi:hypothetical protein
VRRRWEDGRRRGVQNKLSKSRKKKQLVRHESRMWAIVLPFPCALSRASPCGNRNIHQPATTRDRAAQVPNKRRKTYHRALSWARSRESDLLGGRQLPQTKAILPSMFHHHRAKACALPASGQFAKTIAASLGSPQQIQPRHKPSLPCLHTNNPPTQTQRQDLVIQSTK